MRCSCYIVAVWLGVVFTGSPACAGRLVSPAEGQVLDRLPIEFKWETPNSAYPVVLVLYHEQREEPRTISMARPDHRCRVGGLASGKYRWNVLDRTANPIGEKYGSFELRLPAPPSSGKPETSSVPATVSELLKPGASPATPNAPPLKKTPPAQKPPANPPVQGARVSPSIPNVQPPSKPAPAASKRSTGPVVQAKPGWSWRMKLAVMLLVLCATTAIGIAVTWWIDSRKRDTEYSAYARGMLTPDPQGIGVNTTITRIQQLEGKAGHLENTVTPLDTKVTHIEEALTRLQQFLANEPDRWRESLKGYVPTKRLEEIFSAAEPTVNRGLHKIEEQGRDIKALQEDLSAMQESLKSLLSERRAVALAACKQVDAWMEQLRCGVPRETTMLLKALTRASRAETLPQLRDTSQQLLSEIYASVGGAALRNRTGAVRKLEDIREKLDQLSAGNDTGIQQKVDHLQEEAEKIFSPYANGQGQEGRQERLDPELAERSRRILIKELGMPYISIVMGRYAGNATAASALISDVLGDLGLELIKIVVGQTRPEERLHDVQAETPATDKCPAGTIANVIKMGYVNQDTEEISRAQVFVAQWPARLGAGNTVANPGEI